ncbi:hypothetical protein RB195_014772 [Necator americanus]|uniref:Uncharacterized protein n=1 Tax=Necator americanus TaxID=51031 RepID=A0ABR1E1K9_NECAM
MGKKSTTTNTGNGNGKTEVNVNDLKEEAKQLVTKIQGHFLAIEEHRRKDRELWRTLNRRIESLEEVKSERGKRRVVKKPTDVSSPGAGKAPDAVKAVQ